MLWTVTHWQGLLQHLREQSQRHWSQLCFSCFDKSKVVTSSSPPCYPALTARQWAIEWRPWSMSVTTGPLVMCERCTSAGRAQAVGFPPGGEGAYMNYFKFLAEVVLVILKWSIFPWWCIEKHSIEHTAQVQMDQGESLWSYINCNCIIL